MNSKEKIGKKGIVISDIDPIKGTGLVKINGETWSAKTDNEAPIAKDIEITVLSIDGVKLIVKPV